MLYSLLEYKHCRKGTCKQFRRSARITARLDPRSSNINAPLLGVGIAYKVGYNKITDVIPDEYNLQLAPTSAIVLGSIVVFISFLGCCGAVKESNCMLFTYGCILLALLIAQVAIGVYAVVAIYKDDQDADVTLKNAINEAVGKLFGQYNQDTEATNVINYIQENHECCGVEGPSYWGTNIPSSCGSPTFQEGCASALYDYFLRTGKAAAWVLIGFVVTELIGTIFACGLASSVRSRGKHY